MKKLALASLVLFFSVFINACQKIGMDNDAAKIQESVEKIKTKIQDGIGKEGN